MVWKDGMTFDDYVKWAVGEKNYQTLGDTRLLFGVIPAYPLFMSLAVLAVIILCAYQLKRKGIPLRDFEIGLVIVVPVAVLGASVLGKIFLPNYQSWTNIWKIVFFWDPGMSFFGCFFFGFFAGFIWFYKRGRITKISMWVYFDIIVVNVLIGQAIGRWGNLYNHEILGWDVSYDQISWLPDFIKQRLFYFPELGYYQDVSGNPLPVNWITEYFKNPNFAQGYHDASLKTTPTLDKIMDETLQFKAPLFLIEGTLNIILWFIITFGVRNLHKVINYKNNPWSTKPQAFPCRWNKDYNTISENELIDWATLGPIKYKSHKNKQLSMNLENVWRKAYFWKTPDYDALIEFKSKTEKFQDQLIIDRQRMSKENFKQKYNFQVRYFNINPYAREIGEACNPHKYRVVKSGVMTGVYIFGYGLIRIILETTRRPTEYMIANHPIPDFIVLSLILIAGIVIIVLAQFVIPNKWREVGWLYEKSY